MPPQARTARQRAATNENDENAAPARLTRAKAGIGGSENVTEGMVKKALAGKKATTITGAAGPKRALGDATNRMKTDATKDKKGAVKALGPKTTNGVTKPTRATTQKKVESLKRTSSQAMNVDPVLKKQRSDKDESEQEDVKPAAVRVTKVVEEVKIEVTQPAVEEVAEGEIVEDLDTEDLEDPLMVAEYAVEIFEYLRELEMSTMANPDYMDHQDHVDWSDRDILNDWLVQVHQRFGLLPETFYLAINIVDRFLSTKIVQLDKLQLVGITALFIASKYEEVISPHITNFSYMAKDYPDSEILAAERFVLQALNYNLSYPNPLNFLRRISKADSYDIQCRTLGKYLLEISMMDHTFLQYPPSLCAAAAMYTARLILKRGPWDATLAHYSGYTEEQIEPVFEQLIEYCAGDIRHEAFDNKYASKKFLKASLVIRQWCARYLAKQQMQAAQHTAAVKATTSNPVSTKKA